MDLDRPYFRNPNTTTSSELLICFSNSRLSSSSSMKLTRSILSPGRAARDGGGPVSLSSSLSRRLRNNGSIKGGQASPFFSSSKKRGCGFENPEPSSPKVTCIGQVRVKTKKRMKKNRSLSRRRSGEVSFRKMDLSQTDGGQQQNEEKFQQQRFSSTPGAHYHNNQRNQRSAHFSICEAFSCLFPCKSSCFPSERGKVENGNGSCNGNENGCGAMFTRWLVSYNDGEDGRRREIELVVGGGDEVEEVEKEEERRISMRSSRRHVFEDIEVKDDRVEVKGQICNNEEAPARMSICIPPKNALLLMRCRSDPMKVAALANRFTWDPNNEIVTNIEEENVNYNDSDEIEDLEVKEEIPGEVLDQDVAVLLESDAEIPVKGETFEMEVGEEEQFNDDELENEKDEEKEEVESNMSSFEDLLEIADQNYEDGPIQDSEEVAESNPICHLSPSSESEDNENSNEVPLLSEEAPIEKLDMEETIEEDNSVKSVPEKTDQEDEKEEEIPENLELVIIDERTNSNEEKEKPDPVLPDCLLLMMCEPKLSMEVSKETWVCRTDFVRWLPERAPKLPVLPKTTQSGRGEPVKRRLSTDSKPPRHSVDKNVKEQPQQPARSSCSLPPAAASMASMIEQKLVNAVGYEPFVLTRCKSEPMRTAAAKLMPESFYWKNAIKKLEPHRRATVSAAGVAGAGC